MAKQRVQKDLKQWREFLEDRRQRLTDAERRAFYERFLGITPLPPGLVRAGEYFGLDPTDVIESNVLLQILCAVLFPRKGRRSGSKEWSALRLSLLAYRAREIEKERPGLKDSDIAEIICKRFKKEELSGKKEYKNANIVRLQLPRARSLLKTWRGGWENEMNEQRLRRVLDDIKGGRGKLRLEWGGNPKYAEWYAKKIEPYEMREIIKDIEGRLQAIEAQRASPITC